MWHFSNFPEETQVGKTYFIHKSWTETCKYIQAFNTILAQCLMNNVMWILAHLSFPASQYNKDYPWEHVSASLLGAIQHFKFRNGKIALECVAMLIYNLAVCKRKVWATAKSETQPVAESSFSLKATMNYEVHGTDIGISTFVQTDALYNRFNIVVICSGGGTGRM